MIGSLWFLLPTSFHPNPNSLGGGGEGVIGFVGYLMEVGSLIFGLFIIRFEMQLLLLSLGRAFGKLRFLKGWHSLRGQQLMFRF